MEDVRCFALIYKVREKNLQNVYLYLALVSVVGVNWAYIFGKL